VFDRVEDQLFGGVIDVGCALQEAGTGNAEPMQAVLG
jgi:hypothetical protein